MPNPGEGRTYANFVRVRSGLGSCDLAPAPQAHVNPVRSRVQTLIDRRFYRRKYDAESILAQFGTVARDEVNLEALTSELLVAVNETAAAAGIVVGMRRREAEGVVPTVLTLRADPGAEMAAFEAEIADDVDTAQEKEHEEEERRAYERVLEVVEAQRMMDQHLDQIKNKMREAKERRDAAAAQAKTVVSQKEEDMSDIDSDEEAAFEDFSNDWRARG